MKGIWLSLVLALFSASLFGCDDSKLESFRRQVVQCKKDLAQKGEQLEEIVAQLEEVESAAEKVTSSMEDVKSEVGNFDIYDWQVVVPDVEAKTEALDSAVSELEKEIESVQSLAR